LSRGFSDFNSQPLPFQKGDSEIKGTKSRESCDPSSNRGPRTGGEKKTVSCKLITSNCAAAVREDIENCVGLKLHQFPITFASSTNSNELSILLLEI
jgi:hypothetical protein